MELSQDIKVSTPEHWQPIIEDLFEDLKDLPVTILELKQSFYRLDIAYKTPSTVTQDEIDQIRLSINAAQKAIWELETYLA